MKAVWIAVLLAAVAAPLWAAEPFDVAITVDDLPVHGKLPPGMTWLGIADAHLKTFKAHGVPEAFGFVNAVKLIDSAENAAVLDAWRSAGHPLGNHTYSHMNLEHAPSLEAWKADVVAGEPAVFNRMAGADWRVLRLAFLNAGENRRENAFAFLRDRGYRIADVSVSFSDWAYTDTYARCVAKGDNAAIAAMKSHYLERVDDAIARMKQDSKQVYGRIIPQVLLTHMGGWSAVTLPEVMKRLDAAGARYVSLAQVHTDPAYAQAGGGSIIARTAKLKGITLPPDTVYATQLDLNTLCI